MSLTYEVFSKNLAAVHRAIADACAAAGRSPTTVTLLPVTKTHPAEAAAFVARAGLRAVGENRVQEAAAKKPFVAAPLDWELIGHLQSNKARQAAEIFSRVQSVDSAKLLHALDRATPEGKRLRVLLQINAGNDPAKFGANPEEAAALLEAALGCKNLCVDGLMTIAPLSENRDVARRCFANLRTIRDQLATQFSTPLHELSMGMSSDLHEAIAEGATVVRVGTALFGSRV